jgi:hypothetical protein
MGAFVIALAGFGFQFVRALNRALRREKLVAPRIGVRQ